MQQVRPPLDKTPQKVSEINTSIRSANIVRILVSLQAFT